MDTNNKLEFQAKIFKPGEVPRQPFEIWWALRLLKIPGMTSLAKRIITHYFPNCINVSMQPGFKILYGNITAQKCFLC